MYNLIYQNGIYPKTVAIGNPAFSSTQLSSLQAIATQCPLSGGEAVLWARDMLTLSPDIPLFYNDAASCGNNAMPSEERTLANSEIEFVQIRPNPASEGVVIEYSFASGQSRKQLVLFNVFGQVAAKVELAVQQGEVNFPIHSLPSGLYRFVIPGSIITGNLVIIH